MMTSFGWESKARHVSFHLWINVWVAGKIISCKSYLSTSVAHLLHKLALSQSPDLYVKQQMETDLSLFGVKYSS